MLDAFRYLLCSKLCWHDNRPVPTQHIKDPTRISGSSATLIDHIIGTSSLTVSDVYQASGISDHRMQVADFSISLMKCLPRSVWVDLSRSVTG